MASSWEGFKGISVGSFYFRGLDQIANISKTLFKRFVKDSYKKKAMEFLLKEKESLSKLENLNYTSLSMQKYLKSNKVSTQHKKFIFRLRTRMLKVGRNFGKQNLCPLCHLHEDDQRGLLDCIIIKLNCKELYGKRDEKYESIFSSNIEEITNISKLMQQCLRTREELLQQRQKEKENEN